MLILTQLLARRGEQNQRDLGMQEEEQPMSQQCLQHQEQDSAVLA